MTLAQFKNLAFPDVALAGRFTAAICTDNPKWTKLADAMPASTPELHAGVVECSYYTDSKSFTMRSIVSIGQENTLFDTDFAFYQGRLFRIRGASQRGAEANVVEALTAQYGAPIAAERATTQNKLGTVIPLATYRWTVGADQIEVEAPGAGRVDQIGVIYLDVITAKALKTELDRIDPPANRM